MSPGFRRVRLAFAAWVGLALACAGLWHAPAPASPAEGGRPVPQLTPPSADADQSALRQGTGGTGAPGWRAPGDTPSPIVASPEAVTGGTAGSPVRTRIPPPASRPPVRVLFCVWLN